MMRYESTAAIMMLVIASLFVSCRTTPAPEGPEPEEPTYSIGGTVSGLDGSLTLQNNESDDLTISADGAFTFATRLRQGMVYSVTLLDHPVLQNCAVQGGWGEVGTADVTSVEVSCADKEWQSAAGLGATVIDGNPQAAMAPDGRGFVVWVADSGQVNRVYAASLKDGVWSSPVAISPEASGGDASRPRVAAGPDGEALAVWVQSNGSKKMIYSASFQGGSWRAAQRVSDDSLQDCADPQVVFGPAGGAVAVWQQDTGSRNAIFAAGYSGGAWQDDHQISPDSGGNAMTPQAAFDAAGDVVAVWSQYGGSHWRVYASWRSDGVWNGAETVLSADSGDAFSPRVVSPAAGQAIAVWQQEDAGVDRIYATSYSGGSWSAAQAISNSSGGESRNPDLATGPAGYAAAIWEQEDNAGHWRVYTAANRGSWQAPLLLNENLSDARDSDIALDAAGNGLAVWSQDVAGGDVLIYRSRLRDGVWSAAAAHSPTGAGGNAFAPRAALSQGGDALSVWRVNEASGTAFQVMERAFW